MATKQATKYKEQGNKAFKEGDHAKAIEYYTYATELDPKNPIFFTNRSTAYFKMKKFDKSLRDANKAIKCDPKWAKGFYRKGMVLLETEKYKDALEALEVASKLAPKNESFAKAVITAKSKLMEGMSPAEIYKTDANVLFKKGKIDEAIELYTKGIKCCSTSDPKQKLVKADLYANRGACYRQLYQSKNVVHDCTEAIKLNPTHVKAFIRRGQAKESLERFKEALDDFQQASYLAPGATVAVQGASRIRSSLKREQKI